VVTVGFRILCWGKFNYRRDHPEKIAAPGRSPRTKGAFSPIEPASREQGKSSLAMTTSAWWPVIQSKGRERQDMLQADKYWQILRPK